MSHAEVTHLVNDVMLHPDFRLADLKKFDAQQENWKADTADGYIDIEVPSGSKHIPSRTFSIPGLHYRKITTMIKEAYESPLALKFHYTPFKLYRRCPANGSEAKKDERVYSEMYNTDALVDEHDKVQRAPTNDLNCKREKVVAALMFWSDATHLMLFGTAKMWPIYLHFGELSKYIRAQPNSGATTHLAYIPPFPDSLQDQIGAFHEKWGTQKKEIITHCRRELMQAVWRLLLDDNFLHAYTYGVVICCADGVERRVYPRILTYSADYPEKILLATIRDQGLCPCPRCLVSKSKTDKVGLVADMKTRVERARKYLTHAVNEAREAIYTLGIPIGGVTVERLLKPTSSVPTKNAFIERLGPNFNLSQMLVVNFMHEFELGVWKTLFTHLIRILYAAAPGGRLVAELDER
ncbi:hypothetical protein BJV78DRAFT_1276905 [Lactifluus subvellereus]|nr:hypothetical protein BJV78DRAFT_1276905 [Lactifluus subvellereus]